MDNELYSSLFYSNGAAVLKDLKNLENGMDPPGISGKETRFVYSTHEYTLLSHIFEVAVAQTLPAAQQKTLCFTDVCKEVIAPLGLQDTILDQHHSIIYNRSRQYARIKQSCMDAAVLQGISASFGLFNSSYVDNSCKYAGGVYLSTADDIAKLGMKLATNDGTFVRMSTFSTLFTPTTANRRYGLGFALYEDPRFPRHSGFGHSGGAAGGSSQLIVFSSEEGGGVLANLQDVHLEQLTRNLCYLFAPLHPEPDRSTYTTAAHSDPAHTRHCGIPH